MSKVFPGRYTTDSKREFVVFIIGMRVNKWWKIHKWLMVAMAMPKMLALLQKDRSLGMLSAESFFRLFPITTCLVSYWENFEKLDRFASDKSLPHLEPWTRYMREIGASGDVGIYHETYKISRGSYECIYGNMPRFGLAAATTHMTVSQARHAAKARF